MAIWALQTPYIYYLGITLIQINYFQYCTLNPIVGFYPSFTYRKKEGNILDPKNHSPNFHSEYETVSEVPPLCLDDVASIQSPKAESTFHDLSSLRTFSTPRDQNSSNSDSMPTKCSDFDDSYLSSATSAPCKIVPAPPLPLLVMDKEEDLAKAKVSVKPTEIFINKQEDHSNLQNTFVNSIKTSEQKTHEHQLIGGKIEQLRLLSFENPKQLMDKKMRMRLRYVL